jgi:hypothetical protein
MPENKLFLTIVYLLSLLGIVLSACHSIQCEIAAIIAPSSAEEFEAISERELYFINIQPQPGVVAYNRVEAFIQAHVFLDAVETAISDNQFSDDELVQIAQMAANAEASLYNTGDWQIFKHARQIDELSKYAFQGEISQAEIGLGELKRSLPARPQP